MCGVSAGRVIVVFRGGYGKMDLGAVASCVFTGVGGGGGHKTMARAEAALVDLPGEARSGLEGVRVPAHLLGRGKTPQKHVQPSEEGRGGTRTREPGQITPGWALRPVFTGRAVRLRNLHNGHCV